MSRTVLITGTSSGIGEASAKYFIKKGWNVAATMRKPQNAGKWTKANKQLDEINYTNKQRERLISLG